MAGSLFPAGMAREFVTLPQPLERDIELLSELGNLSHIGSNCSRCANGSLNALGPDGDPYDRTRVGWVVQWAGEDVLHTALPVMFVWGILTGLLTLVVLTKQSHVSSNAYMFGLITSSVGLLVCGTLLKIQIYIGEFNAYHYMYGNLKGLNDWFWYTSLWVLVVMTLERSMTVTQNRPKSVCSATQAIVLTIMVFTVCLVSALPEFWEYEVVETFDYGTNQTYVLTQTSAVAESPEYRIMYFWYTMSIVLFLPYPVLVIMTTVLVRGMRKSSSCRRRYNTNSTNKHSSGSILNRKVTEELHITRLFIVLIVLYLLLTGPFTVLRLMERVAPELLLANELLYKALSDVFEFAFYFYFSIHFLLFCSYMDRFRYSLGRMLCCCCPRCCCYSGSGSGNDGGGGGGCCSGGCCDTRRRRKQREWQAVATKPHTR